MKKLPIWLMLIMSAHAIGADSDSFKKYRSQTGISLILCESTTRLSEAIRRAGGKQTEKSDYQSCIDSAKSEAKNNYNYIINSINKPDAIKALKNYHVTYITSINNVAPDLDETDTDYTKRQNISKKNLDEAWTRFEIEQ